MKFEDLTPEQLEQAKKCKPIWFGRDVGHDLIMACSYALRNNL